MVSFLTSSDPKILFTVGLPWFKLYRTLFEQDEIKHLKRQKNGGTYISLFLELVGIAIDHQGQLIYEAGGEFYTYDDDLIAQETKWPYDEVRMGLLQLRQLGLIVKKDEIYVIPYAIKVTTKSPGAIATQKWRNKQREITCDITRDITHDIDRDVKKKRNIEIKISRDNKQKNLAFACCQSDYEKFSKEYIEALQNGKSS